MVDENPGLVSVSDLPEYVELFSDPEDPSKGVIFNCIIGWQCEKINRAKWHAYGLFDTYNMVEPGRPERSTPAYRALTTPVSLF